MIRLLIILIVIGLAAAAVRRLTRPEIRNQTGAPEKLLRCAHCGMYVTEESSVREGDRVYCSEQHRREAAQQD
jgi:uncharacterized protein